MRLKSSIRKLIQVLAVLMLSFSSSLGQLDSSSVAMSFISEPDRWDSTMMTDVLLVETSVNDTSELQEIVVAVCDYHSGNTITIQKISKQEYFATGAYSGLVMENRFFYLDPNLEYKIITRVVRTDGASLKDSTCDNVN